ncbi:ABC transporter permease subunit [Pseudoroseomonas wenyumeiae]|uniref:ABC transporter permease subunit n=1 Tax=Teichococcus wenyumeiae TaxID=2478470 RepID=A0A3A9JQ00_9PROT|nr:ABC transporter permease [Pseudoroseomonas wenyumeiae]RKK05884.1 ABC transporter permease subunit [Pseudoroseomonas wenyumeiae]RMI25887.1 ABC transporter permease subunit [Pseudoroseomonas wenyumeiae]
MHDLLQATGLAMGLILGGDAELWQVILLSLRVSGTAAAVAFVVGLPLAALLVMSNFRGRDLLLLLSNAALGLPPVVVGLVCYLLLSRSGLLGGLGWLFRPAGMVLAQTLLALPIVVALSSRALAPFWAEYRDVLLIDGAGFRQSLLELARMARPPLLTVFLAAFGRAIAEVGAILIVGGNIRGETRTMTTAIALETQKGDLPLALALGGLLLLMCLGVSTVTLLLDRRA